MQRQSSGNKGGRNKTKEIPIATRSNPAIASIDAEYGLSFII